MDPYKGLGSTYPELRRLEHLEAGLERWSRMILDLHERVSRWDQLLINERLSTAERALWGGQTADNVGLLQFVKVELDGVKRDLQALAVSKGTLS